MVRQSKRPSKTLSLSRHYFRKRYDILSRDGMSIFSSRTNTLKKKEEINNYLKNIYKKYLKFTPGNKNLVIDAENLASSTSLSSIDINREDILVANTDEDIISMASTQYKTVLGDIEEKLPELITEPICFYYLDFTRQLYSKKHWKYVNNQKKKHSRLLNDDLINNVISNMIFHDLDEILLNITFSLRGCPGLKTNFHTKISYFLNLINKKVKECGYFIYILKLDWYSLPSEKSSIGKEQPMIFLSFLIEKYENIIPPIAFLSVPNKKSVVGKSVSKLVSSYTKKNNQNIIIK